MANLYDLIIYKKSLDLVVKVYKLIKENPILAKDFSLCDQMKRAAVSIACNISEGYLRSKRQFQNYLGIAIGSANELVTLLIIVNLVYKIDTDKLKEECLYLARQINSFSNKF